MLEKTRKISWGKWGIFCLFATFLSILIGFGLSYIENLRYPIPWTNAMHVSMEIALNEFAGEVTGNTVFFNQRMGALTGILIFLIIGPGLLILYGYESKSSGAKPDQDTNRWEFKTGIVITMMSLLPFTLEAILTPIVQANTRTSASRSEKIDELRQDLLLLGADSFEYMVLPEYYGGGGGSFEGLQLNDLPSYNNISNNYSIQETNTDTVLRIVARGKPDYAVDHKDLNKVAVSIEIRPSNLMDLNKLKGSPEENINLITKFNQPLKAGWEAINE